jgi:hypothetical protein
MWSFREQVVISLIEAQGHVVHVDPGSDREWVACKRCANSWWLARRAQMADDPSIMMEDHEGKPLNIEPLVFQKCPQTRNV